MSSMDLPDCVPPLPAAGIRDVCPAHGFYIDSRDLNSSPHASMANTVPTEPFPQDPVPESFLTLWWKDQPTKSQKAGFSFRLHHRRDAWLQKSQTLTSMTCLFLCDRKGMDRILPGTPVTPTGRHAAFYWAKHGAECIKPLLGSLSHLSYRNDLGRCGDTGDFLREGAWRDQTPGIPSSPGMRNWNTGFVLSV